MIPSSCDCGGALVDYGGDYWHPPDGVICSACGRIDEQIITQHLALVCDMRNCGWCLLILEECDPIPAVAAAIRRRMDPELLS